MVCLRLFIAVQLSDEVRSAVAGVQETLMRRGVRGNYSSAENLHLTLAFIGEYPDPDEVLDALDTVSFDPFPLKTDGFGSFGDLWWIGLSGSQQLEAAVRRVRHALSDAGIPFDRKRFSPHITIIRKASYGGKDRYPAMEIPAAEMTVERISLMRSDRGKHGMIYTELGCIQSTAE